VPAGSQSSASGSAQQAGSRSANLPGDQSAAGSQDGQNSSVSGAAQSSGSQGNNPGQNAGTQSRLPGDAAGNSSGRDGATGDLNGGNNGNLGGNSGTLGGPGGDYSLDTLPDGVLSGGSDQGDGQGQSAATTNSGPMTSAERAAVLDERLRRGYETFDGFLLGERERAQAESNAAGSARIGQSEGSGSGNSSAMPQTMPEQGATPGGVVVASQPVQSSTAPTESFPPPEDIPSGRDDDVVARQLREAAMSEPDPELREALWDEYRNYTGLGDPQ